MPEDPVKKLRFAIAIATNAPPCEPVLYRGNIVDAMNKAQLFGYDAVEIHARSPRELDLELLQTHCAKTGMRIAALATGMAKRIDGFCFIDNNEEIRNAAVKRVCEFADFAAQFGAGIIIGSLRGMIPDKNDRKICDDRFYACMKKILEAAGRRNVPLFIEVINRYENNYLNTAEETLEYLKPLGSDLVKVHLDTFHMNIEETDMCKAITMCKSSLGHIHLSDNTRNFIGSGSIDFGKVIQAAKSIGYDGCYSLECLPGSCADTSVRLSIKNLKRITGNLA